MKFEVEMPNWEMLREQKITLLNIVFNPKDYPKLTEKDLECIQGIIDYIDYLQDTAIEDYDVPEEKVIYPEQEPTDNA
jgi:hypothetical protein